MFENEQVAATTSGSYVVVEAEKPESSMTVPRSKFDLVLVLQRLAARLGLILDLPDLAAAPLHLIGGKNLTRTGKCPDFIPAGIPDARVAPGMEMTEPVAAPVLPDIVLQAHQVTVEHRAAFFADGMDPELLSSTPVKFSEFSGAGPGVAKRSGPPAADPLAAKRSFVFQHDLVPTSNPVPPRIGQLAVPSFERRLEILSDVLPGVRQLRVPPWKRYLVAVRPPVPDLLCRVHDLVEVSLELVSVAERQSAHHFGCDEKKIGVGDGNRDGFALFWVFCVEV